MMCFPVGVQAPSDPYAVQSNEPSLFIELLIVAIEAAQSAFNFVRRALQAHA